jgi:hypothetical protein
MEKSAHFSMLFFLESHQLITEMIRKNLKKQFMPCRPGKGIKAAWKGQETPLGLSTISFPMEQKPCW